MITWFEFWTPDIEGAKAFYGQVFGWTFRATPEYDPDYWFIHPGPESPPGGAIRACAGEPSPVRAGTVVYLRVADLPRALETVTSLGGAIERDLTPIEDGSGDSFAIVRDPYGNRVGMIA